jgi:eukaryotic-like serine/threonine-protein kinase
MPDVADVGGSSQVVLLPAGSTFGNYIVHECIGQGAMGKVYRAEHALLEKPVALKVLDSSLLESADARQRFLREGQAAVAIKHGNVVDITDVGVFEGRPYLVMELLEGEDLQVRIDRREPLSERDIASLLIPVAAALGAAHDRGVLHRDLKPSNIFLSRGPDGELIPKILDFGISKIGRALAATDFEATPGDQLMGSPLYLPPEAVRGSRDLTAKSDQYSLGVVLYECVTGRPPFLGDSLLAILNQIAAGEYDKPSRLRSDVSVAMERVIVRALQLDPSQRYDHVRDLGRALLEVAGVRTQMLWGPAFGRTDLSEPPFDSVSTSPLVLSRRSSTAPAPSSKSRTARHVWLGVATLAAIMLPNVWSLLSPSEPTPSGSMDARRSTLGEASLTPHAVPAAATRGEALAPLVDGLVASRPLERDTRSDPPLTALPGALSSATSSTLASAAPSSPAPFVTPNDPSLKLPERARQSERPRLSGTSEGGPSAREIPEWFPLGAARERLWREVVRRRALSADVATAGANEAPILD